MPSGDDLHAGLMLGAASLVAAYWADLRPMIPAASSRSGHVRTVRSDRPVYRTSAAHGIPQRAWGDVRLWGGRQGTATKECLTAAY